MNIPPSNNKLINDKTLSSSPESNPTLSSLSRRTNDFTADRVKAALSLTGDESPVDAKKSLIDLDLFPALEISSEGMKIKQRYD